MNILITGATGYVGQHLIQHLDNKSMHCIYAVVRNPYDNDSVKKFSKRIHIIDSRDLPSLNYISIDLVVHLAAFLTSKDDMESVRNVLDSNILFGVDLLNSIKNHHNLSFINFGTFAEYRTGTKHPDFAYFYAAAKHAYRSFLQYYAEKGNWSYIHLIPYTIYGGTNKQKKIIDYISDSLGAKTPIAMSPGEQILDFIHISDVVDCISFMIDNKKNWMGQHGKVYHLGTGCGTSLRSIASMFEHISGKKCNIQWGGVPYREQDVMYAVAPIDDLIRLGWRPKVDITTGVCKIIKSKQIVNFKLNLTGGVIFVFLLLPLYARKQHEKNINYWSHWLYRAASA